MTSQCAAAISEEYVLDKSKISNACLVLLVGVVLLLITSDQIWSRSVDLAHHYALVERLLEPGGVGLSRDPSLNEMQVYPRLGHLFATLVARPFGSPIVGMAITGTVSLIAVWVAIGYILSGFGSALVGRVLLATAGSLLIGGGALRLQIFGKEIVGNYFFSQLIAQAALLAVIAVAMHMEQRSIARGIRYGFVAASIFAIESIHLLPAIEGLGFLGMLLLSDIADSWNAAITKHAFARALLTSTLLLISMSVAVIAHPTFAVMRTISENNGDLPLTLFHSLTGLLTLAVAVMVLSAALLIRWGKMATDIRLGALPLKYVGALGASCSVLFVLQWLGLHLGQGSEYACKKYVFALASLLLLELPLFFIATPKSFDVDTGPISNKRSRFKHLAALMTFIVIAFFSAIPRHVELSVSSTRKIEREVEKLQAFRQEHDVRGTAIAIHLSSPSPLLDYMFSIATLKAPQTDTTLDLLHNRAPLGLDGVSMIVTARNDRIYDAKQCRLTAGANSLVAVDARCLAAQRRANSACADIFDLTSAGAIEPSLLSGFSSPEPAGTWTDATTARFRCELSAARPFHPRVVEVTARAFVPNGHPQRLTLSLGDSATRDTVTFTRPGEIKVVTLPIGGASSGWLSLRFSMPDAVSPAQAGLSADARLLGVQVSAIRFR